MTYIPDKRYVLNSAITQTDDAVVRRAVNDFVLDTNRGLQTGISYEHVVGRCDDVNNTFREIRENCMMSYDWMTTAETMDVESDSADDTSAGIGAIVVCDRDWETTCS